MLIKQVAALLCCISFVTALSVKAEGVEEKMEAYHMIVGVLPQLETQLDKLNTSIDFAESKIKSSQSPAMKNLFQGELDKMEDQKEDLDGKISNLQNIIKELKKDPEVGSLIEGEEATRQLKQKLQKAASLLPKAD